MIIDIDEDVANDPESLRWLDGILGTIEDGWHLWDVAGLEDYSSTLWLTHSDVRGQQIMELYRKAVERSSWSSGNTPHGRRIRVAREPLSGEELAPEPACRLACERLVVLVENRESDGAFLKRVMAELDRQLSRWWNQDPAPVKLDSVGGKGQMVIEVQKHRGRVPRPRYVVVMDSDRKKPGEEPCTEAKRIQQKCDQLGIPCWILAKREAENYLPRELLDLRRNVGQEYRRQVEAWDRLGDDLKDVYDMKDGLTEEDEDDVFDGLPDRDLQLLRPGFGDGVGQCWDEHHGQCAKALSERGRRDLEVGLSLIGREV